MTKNQELKVELSKKDSSDTTEANGTAAKAKRGPLSPDNDLTSKVTIDSITSSNAEIKDSTNESDFSSSVPHNSNVDYTIDLTVNKGTPILTDDYVEIPVTADTGKLYITHGLTMIDAEDGSILGDAEILEDKIVIKFTRISNSKTAAKIRISTTLRGVAGESKGFDTQAELDAYKSAHPTKVDKVKILDKNVNVNVKSNLYLNQKSEFFAWNSIAGDVDVTAKNVRQEKGGSTSTDNTLATWSFGVDRMYGKISITSKEDGKQYPVNVSSVASLALIVGYNQAYDALPDTGGAQYIEDTFPSDIYKEMIDRSEIAFRTVDIAYDSPNMIRPWLYKAYRDGQLVGWNMAGTSFGLKFDDVFTKKEQAAGQTYEQFKASLQKGEYGFYKDADNQDIRFVVNYGNPTSANPAERLTYGDLCDKLGKATIINKFFPVRKVNAEGTALTSVFTEEATNAIYDLVKDWPVTDFSFWQKYELAKPVMKTGTRLPNTATIGGQDVNAVNVYVVGEINLLTYKDGAVILKTDAETGQGIENVEFKIQEKDASGNWVDVDSQYVKDNIVVVNDNGTKKGDRFYTNTNGILNIRGLANGKTYRLQETKAPEGYDSANLATSKEFTISFTNPNEQGSNTDFSLVNTKLKYTVTYKVIPNPNGEAIPAGSPAAPVDSKQYHAKDSVTVKDDLSYEGYTFTGWHTQAGEKVTVNDDDTGFKMPAGNVVLVGYWTAKTTNVSVEKKWEGKKEASVTVHLYADDTKVDTVVLNAGNNWKHTFANLKQYQSGKKIKYTVKEDVPTGYKSQITEPQENSFVITNTNTETTKVKVSKKWEGPEKDSVVIKLIADNTEVPGVTLTLNKAGNWEGEFTGLAKYNKDGSEVKYDVAEVKIDNYDSVKTGSAEKGYVITNKNTEKVSIPVQKKWVGKAADQAVVKLVVGSEVKDTVTLNQGNSWKHTFANLPKYNKDGSKIQYDIAEVKVDGYTTGKSGSAETGFVITNTITGKVSVPVTKQWEGKEGESATINLLADGQKVDSITLTKDNNWQHTFAGLEQYKDGNEIKYTIEEVKLPFYDMSQSGNAQDGFVVTNTYVPPVKTVFKGGTTTQIDGQVVQPGEELSYSVTYKNTTDKEADVVITDKLPAHTEFVSADSDGKFENGIVTWTKKVAAGKSLTVSMTVKVADDVNGEELKNTATVNDGVNEIDTNETINYTPTTPKKEVFKPADTETHIDGKEVKVGEELLYKISYTNTTGKDEKVVIEDKIPEFTSYVEGSADNGGVYKDGVITWTKTVAAGETFEVSFTVKVEKSAGGKTLTNEAVVTAGENEFKTNKTTNPVAEVPKTPDKPKPNVPNKGSKKTGKLAQTGDSTDTLFYSLGFGLAGMSLLALGFFKRNEAKES